MMRNLFLAIPLSVGLACPVAAADLSRQTPIEVSVDLGTANNPFVFSPSELTFQTGKLYKLVLNNPSTDKHYFSALRLVVSQGWWRIGKLA